MINKLSGKLKTKLESSDLTDRINVSIIATPDDDPETSFQNMQKIISYLFGNSCIGIIAHLTSRTVIAKPSISQIYELLEKPYVAYIKKR